ncbi:MAG: YfiR family protein [Acidobacteria bacterium]|nr:YfiR family protein [Acidobacteriota bacterium]
MSSKRTIAFIIGAFVLSMALCKPCFAQATVPDETQVRSAIVANLVRFVAWTSAAKGNPHTILTVGLLGYDQQSAALESYLSSHSIDGKQFQVKKIGHADRAEDCQIVYVTPSEQRRFEEISDSLVRSGVLTVSDDRAFALSGGIVGLPVVGDHIEIQINLLRAQQSGLVISSRLLGLARIVRKADAK